MKKLLLTILLAFIAIPAMAAEPENHQHADGWLKPVEAKFVCMMNNKVFDKPQIAIEVEGKTYYGCCPMCAEKLKNSAELRQGIDPVSGNKVDKASAVIGADPHGMTYYFENEENFHKYASGPMPEMKHEHMGGMDMEGMSGREDHAAAVLPEGKGKINSIDAEKHTINITHEPIEALKWPGMTMDFLVAEDIDFSAFKAGDSVVFTLKATDNNQYSIVNLRKN